MLEIIVIVFVGRKVGDIAGDKGYNPGLFTILFVGLWFIGEFSGLALGLSKYDTLGPAYGLAIIFAFSGGILGFLITVFLPSGNRPRRREEEFDQWGNPIRRRPRGQERAPRRRPRPDRDDEDDDRDRRRRPRYEDEDDDDAPRRRRPRYEDEDEDEPPRRRRPRYDE